LGGLKISYIGISGSLNVGFRSFSDFIILILGPFLITIGSLIVIFFFRLTRGQGLNRLKISSEYVIYDNDFHRAYGFKIPLKQLDYMVVKGQWLLTYHYLKFLSENKTYSCAIPMTHREWFFKKAESIFAKLANSSENI
jgi:hypothetical protein